MVFSGRAHTVVLGKNHLKRLESLGLSFVSQACVACRKSSILLSSAPSYLWRRPTGYFTCGRSWRIAACTCMPYPMRWTCYPCTPTIVCLVVFKTLRRRCLLTIKKFFRLCNGWTTISACASSIRACPTASAKSASVITIEESREEYN